MNDISPETLMRLADNMAAAAANFNAHGYDQFISAREELSTILKEAHLHNLQQQDQRRRSTDT